MVTSAKIINISIPNSFIETHEQVMQLVEDDEEFKKTMSLKVTKDGEKDKRYNKKKLTSAKIRFIEMWFFKMHKLQQMNKQEEKKVEELIKEQNV